MRYAIPGVRLTSEASVKILQYNLTTELSSSRRTYNYQLSFGVVAVFACAVRLYTHSGRVPKVQPYSRTRRRVAPARARVTAHVHVTQSLRLTGLEIVYGLYRYLTHASRMPIREVMNRTSTGRVMRLMHRQRRVVRRQNLHATDAKSDVLCRLLPRFGRSERLRENLREIEPYVRQSCAVSYSASVCWRKHDRVQYRHRNSVSGQLDPWSLSTGVQLTNFEVARVRKPVLTVFKSASLLGRKQAEQG